MRVYNINAALKRGVGGGGRFGYGFGEYGCVREMKFREDCGGDILYDRNLAERIYKVVLDLRSQYNQICKIYVYLSIYLSTLSSSMDHSTSYSFSDTT